MIRMRETETTLFWKIFSLVKKLNGGALSKSILIKQAIVSLAIAYGNNNNRGPLRQDAQYFTVCRLWCVIEKLRLYVA